MKIASTKNENPSNANPNPNTFPKLATSFTVLNEFFNELANNPGKRQGGFLFRSLFEKEGGKKDVQSFRPYTH